jgi:hypothetical protein
MKQENAPGTRHQRLVRRPRGRARSRSRCRSIAMTRIRRIRCPLLTSIPLQLGTFSTPIRSYCHRRISTNHRCAEERKLTMTIQRIHPRKLSITPFARKRSIIRVKLFMPFTIVLPRKAFSTSRPMAHERLFFIMRPNVTYQTPRSAMQCAKERQVRNSPLRLKLLVNVLPHPGNGHTNPASCFRRL